jgi:hypothetical protein
MMTRVLSLFIICSALAASACTSITHEVETRANQPVAGSTATATYYVLTTTLYDFWNGSIEFVSLCQDVHIDDMHSNGVQDKTYFNCKVK